MRDMFGPLPPPLAGEGWGGGERAHLNPVACPLPVPPPQAGEGTMWRQHEALPRREPDEPACAAYFPLTRVTRIFQKRDRKSTRLNSSHLGISYAVFCLKKKKKNSTN